MSLKYSSTTADYLVWSDAMNLIRKLAKDGNYKISLLIALGCFTGLRISDILALRWKQILNTSEFTVIEKKTNKVRTIRINAQLGQHIKECYEQIKPIGINFSEPKRNCFHYPENQCDTKRGEKEVQTTFRQFQLPFP